MDTTLRYVVIEVSVGEAGLTARPALYDTETKRTLHIYRRSDRAAAERKAAELNDGAKPPFFAIQTTRRRVVIQATSPEQAKAIFTGHEPSPRVHALGPFPSFEKDPEAWRLHYAAFLAVQPPFLGWEHGECLLGTAPEPAEGPESAGQWRDF